MKPDPAKVLRELAERAIMARMLSSSLRRHGKPGEFLGRATPEQREALQNLKESDVQNSIRPEWFGG